jgi:flagellar hook assembly protein FlgD
VLGRPWPNPFSATTSTSTDLELRGAAGPSPVAGVYDPRGRLVRKLEVGTLLDAGSRGATRFRGQVRWDGRDARGDLVPSGVYFVRVEAGQHAVARRVVLTR